MLRQHGLLGSDFFGVEGLKIWFEITLAPVDDFDISKPSVSVKGEDITRANQKRWNIVVVEGFEETDSG